MRARGERGASERGASEGRASEEEGASGQRGGYKALWELRGTFGAPLWPMPKRCMVNRYVLVELACVAGQCQLLKCESAMRRATGAL